MKKRRLGNSDLMVSEFVWVVWDLEIQQEDSIHGHWMKKVPEKSSYRGLKQALFL